MGLYEHDFDFKSGFSNWRIEHVNGVVVGREKQNKVASRVTYDQTYETSHVRHDSYTELDFIIKTKEGLEEYVKLFVDLPARDGHNVSLIRAISDGGSQRNVLFINHTLDRYFTLTETKKLFVLNALYAIAAVLLPILYIRFFTFVSTSSLYDFSAWFIAILIGLIPGIVLLILLAKLLSYLPSKKFQKKLDTLREDLSLRYQQSSQIG
ncbi:hypothetical protein [Cycloclasticus sp. P1]|uniref:hypothetical protein n=1 Tax=Cycloclasticus sp. (strain P1) TaxID=385025 RepID=UPI000286B01F|nr:hypothetical protein [Cycloclasticus sp. P1]AFT67691.1 hypothetical protein Q91_1657 [Cycloclasticus sp. P1]